MLRNSRSHNLDLSIKEQSRGGREAFKGKSIAWRLAGDSTRHSSRSYNFLLEVEAKMKKLHSQGSIFYILLENGLTPVW